MSDIVETWRTIGEAADTITALRAKLAEAYRQRDLAEIKRADTERMFEARATALAAEIDSHLEMLRKAIEAGDPKAELLIRVDDARAALGDGK